MCVYFCHERLNLQAEINMYYQKPSMGQNNQKNFGNGIFPFPRLENEFQLETS